MVNYERAPWDKANPLWTRIVNEGLSRIQRKASFIDTFLRSPRRIIWYAWSSAGTWDVAAWYLVMHPCYPIAVGWFGGSDPPEVPPGEWDVGSLVYHSNLFHLFDWSRAEDIKVEAREGESGGDALYRWIQDQYRDVQGRQTLEATPFIDLAFSSASRALSLDDVWTNFKGKFSRDIETVPVNEFYQPPPPEVDAFQNDNYEGEETLSEATWPKLYGYSTQYIDNLGIFVPTGFTINPILTKMVIDDWRWRKYPLLDVVERSVVLDDQMAPTNLSGFYGSGLIDDFSQVPILGNFLKLGKWAWMENQANCRFWPRIYAFGRQAEPIPTPSEMYEMRHIYKDYIQVSLQGPTILEVDEAEVKNLVAMLIQKRYLKPSEAAGWD